MPTEFRYNDSYYDNLPRECWFSLELLKLEGEQTDEEGFTPAAIVW